MMHDPDFVHDVIAVLERLDVTYFVAGSVSSGRWGEARATNDADIVIDANESQIRELVKAFEQDHYAPIEAAMDALRRRSMFNIISNKSAMKVDLVFPRQSPFASEQFNRRRKTEIFGRPAYVQSPEGTVLSKLIWYKKGGSEQQLRDVVGVLLIMKDTLDQDYLDEWAGALDIVAELAEAREAKTDMYPKAESE